MEAFLRDPRAPGDGMTWQERMRAKGIPVTDAESGGRPPVGAFTPGPWECTSVHDGAVGIVTSDQSRLRAHVATVYLRRIQATDPERQATARLIAAAPDLLAALQAIVVLIDPADFPQYEAEYHAARAAIAKATGVTE